MRQCLKSRLQCRNCPGRTMNVGMCAHVEFVLVTILSNTNSANEEDMDAIGMQLDGEVAVISDAEDEDDVMIQNDAVDEFRSRASRNMLPCKTESEILTRTMKSILQRSSNTIIADGLLFIGEDRIFKCPKCKQWMKTSLPTDGSIPTIRKANLHTLHHGCIRIGVVDNICLCGNVVRYEGLSDGFFSVSKFNIFTRELLDAWVFDVCGLGLTFLEAFTSWKRKACSITARNQYIDLPLTLKCRMGNVVFTAFLRTLTLSSEDILHKLFTCDVCLVPDGHGTRR